MEQRTKPSVHEALRRGNKLPSFFILLTPAPSPPPVGSKVVCPKCTSPTTARDKMVYPNQPAPRCSRHDDISPMPPLTAGVKMVYPISAILLGWAVCGIVCVELN
ncbi:ret finger protein-like 1 antisense protein [Platysternon megacephalum]|uniref:Ret finger protein-like 1 antisense protein n=1 Tax=Platysternon megacephalum TaxID=55544 RepID=A0A4D9DL81_9SAUR|nr:ret finger protein-like 1 antisense protein [Platysternon megacephalum]